ncbi:hypothetical protein F0562_019364 [Nyssa sinensis]|uniref:Uncharacterized protein n=1 Tax=Nyssa sinensis TaxID=561372 RepID=A0A5J4ZC41_9ASTE|nr:hypothetical protein F0562_019364 [Nyssa sinensis]
MEPETQSKKIEGTVIEILKDADLEEATEFKVRNMAAERLGIDLSDMDHKRLVRSVIECFLLSLEDKVQEETKEVVQEQETRPNVDAKDVHDVGGRVICKLSDKRNVAIQDSKGKTFVSIRDYYKKDGKQFPSARGISLTTEQWLAFRKSITAIEEAIMKMESRIRSEDTYKEVEADVSDSVTAFAPQGLIPVERKQIEADMPNSVAAFTPQGVIPNGRKQDEADMSNLVPTFAPQGFIPIETTRLDGKNYHFWVRQMEFFLRQIKIAYVLTEPCPNITLSPEASVEEIARARAATQKWVDDNYICHHNILNSLSDHLFDQYSKRTYSAKELWEELKLIYDEAFGTKRSLVYKYIQFQMVDGLSIVEQVQELHNIAMSIIASGMWIDENFHVSVILSKLPQSWKEYRMRLMYEEFLPFNMLMYRLRVEEESRCQTKRGEPSTRAHCAESKLENKLGPKRREMKRPGMCWDIEKDNKAIVCYNCGKKGHISRNCHHGKSDIREKGNEKGNEAVPVVTEADMVEGIVE